MCIQWQLPQCHQAHLQKDSKKRQICVRDSFALCRDCIKGPNLPTHADMTGVNVSAFVVPNSLQYDQGKYQSHTTLCHGMTLMQYNIIPRHPHSSCSFILLSQGEEGTNMRLLH
jgi:hypothetical protein